MQTSTTDPLRLLWIDDEPMMRRAIDLSSDGCGAIITTAGTIQEAREHMESSSFDWIICDYRLGRQTADQFVRELLDRGHPVVVLTGDISSVDPSLAVQVVEKPVLLSDLVHHLGVGLSRS